MQYLQQFLLQLFVRSPQRCVLGDVSIRRSGSGDCKDWRVIKAEAHCLPSSIHLKGMLRDPCILRIHPADRTNTWHHTSHIRHPVCSSYKVATISIVIGHISSPTTTSFGLPMLGRVLMASPRMPLPTTLTKPIQYTIHHTT